ncbi:MAG: hypothetical protein JOS17DRAFT_837421, partial [Linnemannia elongata]
HFRLALFSSQSLLTLFSFSQPSLPPFQNNSTNKMHHFSLSGLVFDIPHLLHEIISSLTPYDLTVCAQVSSSWNHRFEPFLWHNLNFANCGVITHFTTLSSSTSTITPSSSPGAQAGLHRNQHTIHTIRIDNGWALEAALPESHIYPNLTALTFRAMDTWSKPTDRVALLQMIRFLEWNTSLQTIRLEVFPLHKDVVCKMLGEVLGTHPSLKNLEISGGLQANRSSVEYILQGVIGSCSISALKLVSPFHHRCVRIQAQGPSSPPPHVPSLLPPSTSTRGPTATRLKQLWFDPDIHAPEYHTLLLALLSHSPHVERLSFAAPSTPHQLSDLVSAFSKNSKLRHLELIEYNTSALKNSNNNDYPADLIQASTSASSHLHSFTLRSFQTRATSSFIDRAAHALVHHQHSRTLERLDLCKDDEVASKDLQLLLMSCPNLTSFVTIDVEAGESTTKNRSRIHIEDLAAGKWVCLGMKELCIGFTGFSNLTSSYSSSSSFEESATAQFYTVQIYNHLASLPTSKPSASPENYFLSRCHQETAGSPRHPQAVPILTSPSKLVSPNWRL